MPNILIKIGKENSMKKFILTAAEYYQSKYEVEANSFKEAVEKFNRNKAKYINDTTEFCDIDKSRGMGGIIKIVEYETNREMTEHGIIIDSHGNTIGSLNSGEDFGDGKSS